MEVTITKQKENELLKRKELNGTLNFQGATPSNQQLKEELAKKLGSTPDCVAIKHIYTAFGATTAQFNAHVYATKEQHDTIEPKKKEKKADAQSAPAKK